MDDIKLIYAKDAIFKLIAQYSPANKFDDGELYICNYCESSLEAAFCVLDIEDNWIKVEDFCKLWEKNNREIWEYYFPDKNFDGLTADIYHRMFEDKYNLFINNIEEIMNSDA